MKEISISHIVNISGSTWRDKCVTLWLCVFNVQLKPTGTNFLCDLHLVKHNINEIFSLANCLQYFWVEWKPYEEETDLL